jgi:hypothetical protein
MNSVEGFEQAAWGWRISPILAIVFVHQKFRSGVGDEHEICRCHLLNTDWTYGSIFAGRCRCRHKKQ